MLDVMARISLIVAFILFGFVTGPSQAGEKVETLPTRAGVTVKAIVNMDAGPRAPIVILLAGGDGTLSLDSWSGKGSPSGNFLVRSRGLFAANGLNLVVPDAPSDLVGPYSGSLKGSRISIGYAEDMRALINSMRARGITGPAFLVGTSRGTIGAAGAAARLPATVLGGIVLTASVTVTSKNGTGHNIFNADLEAIKIPVLFAHHREDACYVTPDTDIPRVARALKNAPSIKQLYYKDGGPFTGRDCGSSAAHGFVGIEPKVVTDIADWIKKVAAGKTP
jgi:pimeloyl-ACP methyl ester carboxylesterase